MKKDTALSAYIKEGSAVSSDAVPPVMQNRTSSPTNEPNTHLRTSFAVAYQFAERRVRGSFTSSSQFVTTGVRLSMVSRAGPTHVVSKFVAKTR